MQNPITPRAGTSLALLETADLLEDPAAPRTVEASDLIERCASSDCPESWHEFLARYGRPLRDAVRRTLLKAGASLVRDLEDDVLQDVYCKLLADGRRRLRRFRGGDDRSVAGYLCRIAENVTRDHLRRGRAVKRGREVCLVAGDGEDGPIVKAADPCAATDRRALVAEGRRLYFERGSRALPGDNRHRDLEVTYLAVFEGWSSREIAERWQSLTANNVDSIIYRTKLRLAAVDIELRRPPLGCPAHGT